MKKGKKKKPMAENLPGEGPAPTEPRPPLPGVGVPRTTPEQQAKFNNDLQQLHNARKALAEILDVFHRHPELAAWAKSSEAGTLQVPT